MEKKVNTQNHSQRPHPTATLRPVVSGTRRRDDASTNVADKTVLGNSTCQYMAQTTHGFQTRTETPHDIDPLTDTPLSGRGNAASHTTHSKEQQRQTSPTTPPRQTINNDIVSRNTTTHGVLVGTDTIAVTPVQGHSSTAIGQGEQQVKDQRHPQGEHTSTVEGRRQQKNKKGSKQKRSKIQPKTLAGACR